MNKWRGNRGQVILGSSLAFVIGATIMVFLHETVHAVAAAVQGYHPTQIPFAVSYHPQPSVMAHVIIALTAPAFSVVSGVIGIVIDYLCEPFRERPFWRMVWLWTVFASVQEGLGYLQITALFRAGDTAQALELLDAPPMAYIILTIIGWATLPLLAWIFATRIRGLASSESDKTALAVWPWMIGTSGLLVLTAIYVLLGPVREPDVIIAVLALPLGIGVYAPIPMMFATKRFGATSPPSMTWPPIGGLILFGALVAVNLAILPGWFWPQLAGS